MSNIRQARARRRWSKPVALICGAAGVVCFVAVFMVSEQRQVLLFAAVGITFAVTGSVLAVLATKLERVESDLLRDLATLARDVGLTRQFGAVGLSEVWVDSTTYDFGQVITSSRRLVIMLNEGRTWCSVHRDKLRARFADRSTETVVFVIHPESPMIDVLARKASRDSATIRRRIVDTVELLQEIRSPNTSLEILGHFVFNPHALILGDSRALISPYFTARGGRTVPVLCYEDTGASCFFKDIEKDVELLRIDARDISSLSSGRSKDPTLHLVDASSDPDLDNMSA